MQKHGARASEWGGIHFLGVEKEKPYLRYAMPISVRIELGMEFSVECD